jgi:tRNA U34 5-methylaminomethyl-2-thiouridine-forming methyltransferase MnmC
VLLAPLEESFRPVIISVYLLYTLHIAKYSEIKSDLCKVIFNEHYKLEIKLTSDGSHTVYHEGLNEGYHSSHGAVGESRHIFIEAAFMQAIPRPGPMNILEVGFGTGLNALLTRIEADRLGKQVLYTAVEAFPLEKETWSELNYPRLLCPVDCSRTFEKLHLAEWGRTEELSNFFHIHKIHTRFQDYYPEPGLFDVVYFDAFSPAAQPELWTTGIFMKLFMAMKPGAVLTTYSVKGDVIRSMRTAGFSTEKIPGPPGKRQITRAFKPM